MQRVINGTRYNTDKATRIADFERGQFGTSLYCAEALCLSPRGRWFVVGAGGSASRWSKRTASGIYGHGTGLRPLSPGQAQEWLTENGFHALVEEHFAAEIQDA